MCSAYSSKAKMDPKDQPKTNQSRNRAVSDEKSEARELWFKTVVKVLNWKDGPREKNQPVTADKITAKEWSAYYKETIRINAGTAKPKTLKKLQETEDLIKKHGGFAS